MTARTATLLRVIRDEGENKTFQAFYKLDPPMPFALYYDDEDDAIRDIDVVYFSRCERGGLFSTAVFAGDPPDFSYEMIDSRDPLSPEEVFTPWRYTIV